MKAVDLLLSQLQLHIAEEFPAPFPYDDVHALMEVFPEDFGRLAPHHIFSADLDTFMFAIHGWANGGIRLDLTDALARFRAKEWLSLSFFERFPQYDFLAGYDLSEYPGLHRSLTTAEQARLLLLEAIALYEQHG
jgi:hypothetical protein